MESVSKNYYKGLLIDSPGQLIFLARNSESVYHNKIKVKPAAFFISMQFNRVMHMIENRSLFTIIKKSSFNSGEKNG